MMNPMQFAMSMIQRNPQVMNNPMAQNYIGIIQSGDAQKGQQLAENICKSYGMTPQQALQQAKQFFNIR